LSFFGLDNLLAKMPVHGQKGLIQHMMVMSCISLIRVVDLVSVSVHPIDAVAFTVIVVAKVKLHVLGQKEAIRCMMGQ